MLKKIRKQKSSRNTVYDCKYHIVWCVKYRRKFLIGEVEKRLKEIALQCCEKRGYSILEMESDQDHFHILIDGNPMFSVGRLIGEIKGLSSRILRSEFPDLRKKLPCLWTSSYFIATVGGAPLEVIKKYVETQKLRSK